MKHWDFAHFHAYHAFFVPALFVPLFATVVVSLCSQSSCYEETYAQQLNGNVAFGVCFSLSQHVTDVSFEMRSVVSGPETCKRKLVTQKD